VRFDSLASLENWILPS